MKVTRKNGKVKIEIDVVEAGILHMILSYMKPRYFSELEDAPDNGMFSKKFIKETYEKFLDNIL